MRLVLKQDDAQLSPNLPHVDVSNGKVVLRFNDVVPVHGVTHPGGGWGLSVTD